MFKKRNSDGSEETARNIELISQVIRNPSVQDAKSNPKKSIFGFSMKKKNTESTNNLEKVYNSLSTASHDIELEIKQKLIDILLMKCVPASFLKSSQTILIRRNRIILFHSINLLLCLAIILITSPPIASKFLIDYFREQAYIYYASLLSLLPIVLGLIGIIRVNFTMISTYIILSMLSSSLIIIYTFFFILKFNQIKTFFILVLTYHLWNLFAGAYTFQFLKLYYKSSNIIKIRRRSKPIKS